LTVAELATTRPLSVKVLQRHGIDFCCGGGRVLEQACAGRSVDVATLLAEVSAEEAAAQPDTERWDTAPLSTLIDHIVARHHRPLDTELPRLDQLVRKVTRVHHDKDPATMDALLRVWTELTDDLVPHMLKEERALFPLILSGRGAYAGAPVSVMEAEHTQMGELLAELRRLTGGYVAPPEACGSWRALWQGLEALEADLHQHIHLENNVLFPRALDG
jgi:regulator of cell morphogenesis and NO signaling